MSTVPQMYPSTLFQKVVSPYWWVKTSLEWVDGSPNVTHGILLEVFHLHEVIKLPYDKSLKLFSRTLIWIAMFSGHSYQAWLSKLWFYMLNRSIQNLVWPLGYIWHFLWFVKSLKSWFWLWNIYLCMQRKGKRYKVVVV